LLLLLITGALWRLFLHPVRRFEKNTGGFTAVWHSVEDAKRGESGVAKRGKRGSGAG